MAMRESDRDGVEPRISDTSARSGLTISRRSVLVGLAAAALPATRQAVAEVASERPPQFETVRHQFIQVRSAAPVPDIDLQRVDGSTLNLAKLRGKVVLVNFWATWCPACRVEMPMLDRLQQMRARDGLAVVAISVDREGRAVVAPYLRKLNLRHLTVCVDPDSRITHAKGRGDAASPFGLYGMPISYVIDPSGQVQGYMLGQADWSSEAATRLLDHYAQAR
jgi:thiol-disulfide isomerase/thioredoxin